MSALFGWSNITTPTKHVVTLKFFQGNEGTSAKYNTGQEKIYLFLSSKKEKRKKKKS
jgi:hypothetical protein